MMTPVEIGAFLQRPLVGVVSTVRADGGPHAVPVWFRFDEERVNIWTFPERRWVRNLAADPRCSFTVQQQGKPFAAVTLRGHAEFATDAAWAEEEIRRIAGRYIDKRKVEEYIADFPGVGTIVSIYAEKIVAWGKRY